MWVKFCIRMTGKIELSLSTYIRHRSDLMKSLEFPKLSEAKSTLGEELAKIVFDQCDESLKKGLGLTPPLKGARDELWNSPSDLLKGKVALTPPYTRKCIQALTHKGILDIGQGIENKFLHEAEIDKEKALAHQKKDLLDSFQDIIMTEIKDAEAKERAACQRELDKLSNEFEVILAEKLDELEHSLRAEYDSNFENQEQKLQAKWQEKLKEEVENTVKILTKEFFEELQLQEEQLTREFKFEMRKAEMKKSYEIGIEKAQFEEKMRELRHKLECKNIANLICLLCMERRKCLFEKSEIERAYKHEIANLNNRLGNKINEIKELTTALEQAKKDTNLREICVLEILKQYQKFINFVLKASPTQAEFLLSIEKIMLFEFVENALKSDVTFVPAQCDTTLNWQWTNGDSTLQKSNIELKDGHNCLKEIPLAISDEVLPSFTYKDKLYVRQEFRDILLKLNQNENTYDLWLNDNEHVKMLIDVMKEYATADGRYTSNTPCRKDVYAQSSSIQFKISEDHPQNQSRNSSVITGTSATTKRTYQKKALKSSVSSSGKIDYHKIGSFENKANILGTKSSLEILKEKGAVKRTEIKKSTSESMEKEHNTRPTEKDKSIIICKETEEEIFTNLRKPSYESLRLLTNNKPEAVRQPSKCNEGTAIHHSILMETKDSLVLAKVAEHKNEMTPFSIHHKDSINLKQEADLGLRNKGSKLVEAKDSVEMLRHSFSRFRPLQDCKSKQGQKASISGSTARRMSPLLSCPMNCMKRKQSIEVMDGLLTKKPETEISDRALKVSHVEVINVDNRRSQVAFDAVPVLIATNDFSEIIQLYEPTKHTPSKVTQKRKPEDLFVSRAPATAIVGDQTAKEYLQTSKEFTDDRIRSFISLIKDHPNLIKTFTACRR